MAQGVLPFKYEEEKKDTGMTSLGGLPVYLDLATVMGLGDSIAKHLHIKRRGWTDKQFLLSLIMLNLAGGDCVNDLQKLATDDGFCRILRRIEQKQLTRPERRDLALRWRQERVQSLPSPSAVFRYLSAFHDPSQEKERVTGKAFIPTPNEHLRGLMRINGDMLAFIQRCHPQRVATLDQDATLVATTKCDALYSYKHYKAYQPLNTWWADCGTFPRIDYPVGEGQSGDSSFA